MADDLKFTVDVSDVANAHEKIRKFQSQLESVHKQFQNGRLTQEQYSKALSDVGKKNRDLFSSYQKTTGQVSKYTNTLKKLEQQKQKIARDKELELQAKRESQELIKERAEIERLTARYKPLGAAVIAYKKEVGGLISAKRRGIITTDQYREAMSRLKREFREVESGVVSASNQFARYNLATYQSLQSTKRFGSVGLQQVGYQVGDFAVQMQGGTNIAVAFGQQMSQLLGIFGAGGALAGAGIAIGTAFIAPLLDAKKEAMDLSKQFEEIDDLSEALGISFDQNITKSIKRIREEFSGFLADVAELRNQNAQDALKGFLKDLSKSLNIDAFKDSISSSFTFGFMSASKDMAKAKEELDQIEATLNQISGNSMSEVSRSFTEAYEKLRDQGLLTEELKNKLISVADEHGIVLQLLDDEEKKIDASIELWETFVDLLGTASLDNILSQFDQLLARISASVFGVGNLKIALGQAWDGIMDVAQTLQAGRQLNNNDKFSEYDRSAYGDAQEAMREQLSDQRYSPDGRLPAVKLPKVKKSKGGGGSSKSDKTLSDIEAEIKARLKLEKLIGRERVIEENILDIKSKLGNAAKNYTDVQIRTSAERIATIQAEIDKLKEQRETVQGLADTMESSLAEGFMSIVDGTKSVKDAFKDMARSILSELFRVLVVQQLVGSFDTGTGKGSGIVGAVVGAFSGFGSKSANGNIFSNGSVVPFATGGVVNGPTAFPMSGGKTGLMGEAGPEAIMPLKRSKDGKLGVESSGGQSVEVRQNLYFNFQANGDESVKKIIAKSAPQIAQLTKKSILEDRARGGQFKKVFG